MGGGGGETNQSIKQAFNMSALNQSIYNEVTKTSTTTTASGFNIQDLTLNIENLTGCTVQTGQKIQAKTMSSSEFTKDQTTELKAKITNELQASASAAMEKATQLGSEIGQFIGGDTNLEMEQNVKMEVKNLVENNITRETLNSTVAEQVNIQGQTLNVKNCVDSDIRIDQDIVAEVTATSITKMLTKAIADNTMLNQLAASAEGKTKTSAGGFAELADSVFGGIAGVIGTTQEAAKYGIIASVCCVCVIAIVALLAFLSPAGQNMGRKGMNKF
jgi:hypothetical protein